MNRVVSVIVPAYNSEATIVRTLESLMNQTLAEIEIIVVDDGSTDSTLALCEEAQRSDSRIVIVHLEFNQSTLQARRIGVGYASGSYVMFCDADDELVPEAAEQASSFALEGNYDLVHFNISIVSNTGSTHTAWERSLEPFSRELLGDDVLVSSPFGVSGTKINGTVCNKLYDRSLVKKAWAPIPPLLYLSRAEDILQTLLVLRGAHRYGGLSVPLYRYNFGAGKSGQVKNRESFQHFLTSTRAHRAVIDHVSSPEWSDPDGFDSTEMLLRLGEQLIENQLSYWFRLPPPADAALSDLLHNWPAHLVVRVATERFPDRLPHLMESLNRVAPAGL